MLTSLHIKNYRNLKDFTLDSLDQVNLITGKNNTGKSSLLEAVAIYASKGNISLLAELLKNHGEYFREQSDDAGQMANLNLNALSSLFTGRVTGFDVSSGIFIGEAGKGISHEKYEKPNFVELRFVKYDEKSQQDTANTSIVKQRFIIDTIDENDFDEYRTGFYIRWPEGNQLIRLERNIFFPRPLVKPVNSANLEFIHTAYIDRESNGALFDNITLTDKERFVIEALKIIEPKTERIAFIGKGSRERSAVIKLSDNEGVLPLKSMGDGINRILTLILALVNSENGFLLIDEFENGLHYTVQKQLWEIVFSLAKQLNIQVFATTHSEDCISGFEQALNENKEAIKGKLIRLDNVKGVITQTNFSPRELKIANEQNIELR